MSDTTKRIVYQNADGGVSIIVPAEKCDLTIDEIKAKDVPSGVTSYIVDTSQFQLIGVSAMLGPTHLN